MEENAVDETFHSDTLIEQKQTMFSMRKKSAAPKIPGVREILINKFQTFISIQYLPDFASMELPSPAIPLLQADTTTIHSNFIVAWEDTDYTAASVR